MPEDITQQEGMNAPNDTSAQGQNEEVLPMKGEQKVDGSSAKEEEEAEDEESEVEEEEELSPEQEAAVAAKRKKMLYIALLLGGALVLVYFSFSFYLFASLPSPDGGRQSLRMVGNVIYSGAIVVVLAVLVLITGRLLRAELEPDELSQSLLKPGIASLILIGIAALVLFAINQPTPLPIDVLEPKNLKNITAPISVTFGTQRIRSILRNQSLTPKKYLWDFNGDWKVDADVLDPEVTTVFDKKGAHRINLSIPLSNGKIRSTGLTIVIPAAVFDIDPPTVIRSERIRFDVTNLVTEPDKIDTIQWDFDGDGENDLETDELEISYTFVELGTYQTTVLIQIEGGFQETYVRPITVIEELPQPFEVKIETEGVLTGSAPLGIVFKATIEEGVPIRNVRWTFREQSQSNGESVEGVRISHTFSKPAEYIVTLEVTNDIGKKARSRVFVSALEPLHLDEVSVTGTPSPIRESISGTAPLEVKLTPVTKIPFIMFRWEQEGAKRVFSVKDTFHALYSEPGTYELLLIAEDQHNRSQKFSYIVKVGQPESRVFFTAVPPTGVAPLTVTFDASQSFIPDKPITGFAWTFGDEEKKRSDTVAQLLGAQVVHRYELEGTYLVKVEAITEDGKRYPADKTIVVRKPTLDACVFPSRTQGDAPLGVHFNASCSTGNVQTFSWNFGDGSESAVSEPVVDHVFEKPGTYSVSLEVSDGAGNFSTTNISITAK